MSSGSVSGRCRMTVPAIEKMTTRMISTTPVLIELNVFQVLRTADRSDRAMTVRLPQFGGMHVLRQLCECSQIPALQWVERSAQQEQAMEMRHNTHIQPRWLGFHPPAQV